MTTDALIQDKFLPMLTYKRPHGTYEEQEFLFDFIDCIPGMLNDDKGNRILQIGDNPKTCFSAHVDTVHRKGGKQKICYDVNRQMVFKDDNECLGADDGAGCIVLLKLIEEQVPGLYLFHVGEERGGIGSRYIKEKTPAIFKGIERAIAFDRRANSSIITFQRGQRCCSEEFAAALGIQMLAGPHSLVMTPDQGGSFTDTANYMSLVPECTNISVGYQNEHTARETQDVKFLRKLMDTVVTVKWDELPTVRDPKTVERKTYGRVGGNYYQGNDFYDDGYDGWDNYGQKKGPYGTYGRAGGYLGQGRRTNKTKRQKKASVSSITRPRQAKDLFTTTYSKDPETGLMEPEAVKWHELLQFIRQYPRVAADIIDELNLTPDDLMEYYEITENFTFKGI